MAKPSITSAIESPPSDSLDQVRRAHQRRLVYAVFGVLVVLVLYLLAH
jgi:hypothetical protein